MGNSVRLCALLPLALCVWAQTGGSGRFENPHLPAETRAADLVSRMTLDEKVLQMQNSAPALPRLGIPAYDWWNEGLHGVARAGLATVFPQAIGLAATWDTRLMKRVAETISVEARGKYNDAIAHGNHGRYFGLTFWSPNINIFRDPRWGRGQETYGEDPYLTAQFGIAFIRGMQGDDPRYFRVIATAKHYAVHSGPEPSRHGFNVDVNPDDLKYTYTPAFEAAVKEGRADSVMCAYNSVDGEPACANSMLLEKTLRSQWGFGGYVVSDCGAIADIYKGHHYKPTMAAAAAAAVRVGTDLTCGAEYRSLVDAVKQGLITEGEIDRSLTRLFVARLKLGLFDRGPQVPFSSIGMESVDSEAHRKLALEAAERSLVLLKNDGDLLPLAAQGKRIAVLGPSADDPDVLLGNYNGIPSRLVTPWMAMHKRFAQAGATVRFSLGSTYTAGGTALIPASLLTAAAGGAGLRAEYFASTDLSGDPVLRRNEDRVYLQWDMHDPDVTRRVQREQFSVRWTGNLRVPEAGEYALGFTRLRCADCKGGDRAELYVNDKLLIGADQKVMWEPVSSTAALHLEAGTTYRIRLQYRQNGGAAGVQLVWIPPAQALLNEAKRLIADSDVAVICVGLNSQLEGEESKVEIPGFEGGDRTTLALPSPQQDLLDAAYQTGKPLIVVLLNGSALAAGSAKERARAILEAWYPGQDGGTAIAETLAGDNNPSGRLPVTFYESVNQLPPFSDYSMKGRTYRYFTGKPLYPFGYGLSYSRFEYSSLKISQGRTTVSVSNRSRRSGTEIVQLYVTPIESARGQRALAGFESITLKGNETRTVTLPMPSYAVSSVSAGGGQPLAEWTGGAYIEKAIRKP